MYIKLLTIICHILNMIILSGKSNLQIYYTTVSFHG